MTLDQALTRVHELELELAVQAKALTEASHLARSMAYTLAPIKNGSITRATHITIWAKAQDKRMHEQLGLMRLPQL